MFYTPFGFSHSSAHIILWQIGSFIKQRKSAEMRPGMELLVGAYDELFLGYIMSENNHIIKKTKKKIIKYYPIYYYSTKYLIPPLYKHHLVWLGHYYFLLLLLLFCLITGSILTASTTIWVITLSFIYNKTQGKDIGPKLGKLINLIHDIISGSSSHLLFIGHNI